MSSSSIPPPGRRLLLTLSGSLIILTVGILLCLLKAPHYELLFYVFGIYVFWTCLRYFKERQQPDKYLPWYYSKARVAVFGASLSVICGVVGILSNTGYAFDFVL